MESLLPLPSTLLEAAEPKQPGCAPKALSAIPVRPGAAQLPGHGSFGTEREEDRERLGQQRPCQAPELNTWPQKGLQQFLHSQGKAAPILERIFSLCCRFLYLSPSGLRCECFIKHIQPHRPGQAQESHPEPLPVQPQSCSLPSGLTQCWDRHRVLGPSAEGGHGPCHSSHHWVPV